MNLASGGSYLGTNLSLLDNNKNSHAIGRSVPTTLGLENGAKLTISQLAQPGKKSPYLLAYVGLHWGSVWSACQSCHRFLCILTYDVFRTNGSECHATETRTENTNRRSLNRRAIPFVACWKHSYLVFRVLTIREFENWILEVNTQLFSMNF